MRAPTFLCDLNVGTMNTLELIPGGTIRYLANVHASWGTSWLGFAPERGDGLEPRGGAKRNPGLESSKNAKPLKGAAENADAQWGIQGMVARNAIPPPPSGV
ncbi:MAG: hypothetical protein ACYTFA_02375 [Planctomycetota bacterium]